MSYATSIKKSSPRNKKGRRPTKTEMSIPSQVTKRSSEGTLNGDGSKSRMRESTEGGVRSLLDVAIKTKMNSKMDDQIDKRIVVMRARLKKKEANEAAMKAVEDAKKANKNKPVQV